MIIGGLRFVTNGDSSRHGDVSRDDAVLDPPPVEPAFVRHVSFGSS